MSAFLIRLVAEEERAAWQPLWEGYLAFYKAVLAPETTDETWQRLHNPGEPMFALGAYDGKRLAAFAHYIFHRSTWTSGPYCYLQDLFTAEEARRKGAARLLIEEVYQRAKSAGASRVYWLTHESNQAARSLYERVAENAGFIQYRKTIS